MKFTAIAKVEEWLIPNVSRASIMAMWGKVWLRWMSRGQTKYYTVIFKRKRRKNSLWEKKKKSAASIARYLKGKLFLLNSKNFLSFSVSAFSTSYLQNILQASNRNISFKQHFSVLPCLAQYSKVHSDLQDQHQLLLQVLSTPPTHSSWASHHSNSAL